MNKLDNFKQFAKNNPTFASYIKDGSMTWQKFYELYDMYGEDSTIWDEYKKTNKKSTTLNDIVNSLSKAVGLFSDLFQGKATNNENIYKPRAVYKRFED